MSYVLGTGLPPGVNPPPTPRAAAPPPRRLLGDEVGLELDQVVPAQRAKPEWHDLLPRRATRRTAFLSAPSAALDRILSHPILNLRDHLALAATCRTLRACYWTPPGTSTPDHPPASSLWAALIALRRGPVGGKDAPAKICSSGERRAVMRIFSRGVRVDVGTFEVVGAVDRAVDGTNGRRRTAPSAWEGEAIRSAEWEQAIHLVHTETITRTKAKAAYKLTDVDLYYLKHIVENIPHSRRTGAPSVLYVEAAVESLALRLHGGVSGHGALLAKRAASAAKAAATRLANRTRAGSSSTDKDKSSGDAPSSPPQPQKHVGLSETDMIMLVAAQERALEALRRGDGGASGSGAQVPLIDEDGWEMWTSGL
ncbi:hypothetical protein JCM8208_007181 [Rhodotorula glutinis]